jgi:hypothetical protein
MKMMTEMSLQKKLAGENELTRYSKVHISHPFKYFLVI